MGTKENPGRFDCYANAAPDEPMFVLLARDPLASNLVREWALRRANASPTPSPGDAAKIVEAYECADAMDAWRQRVKR